jgi:nitrite reductase (NO-forming)
MAVAAILVACGSPSPARPAAAPARQVDVTMTEFRFSPGPIHAIPGPAVLRVTNAGRVGHDLTVLTPDGSRRLGHTPLVAPGGTATLRLDLSPGTYQVICTQPGHQESGMETRLEVDQQPS